MRIFPRPSWHVAGEEKPIVKPDKGVMFLLCLSSSVLQVKLSRLASPPDAIEKHSLNGSRPFASFCVYGSASRRAWTNLHGNKCCCCDIFLNSFCLAFFLVRTQPATSSLTCYIPSSLLPPNPVSSSMLDNDFAAPATPLSILFPFRCVFLGYFSFFAGASVGHMRVCEESHAGPH